MLVPDVADPSRAGMAGERNVEHVLHATTEPHLVVEAAGAYASRGCAGRTEQVWCRRRSGE